jgi:hypothetical protein
MAERQQKQGKTGKASIKERGSGEEKPSIHHRTKRKQSEVKSED